MSYSSEDETDISDSELEEYVDRCYDQLKARTHKVRFSDDLYRCPYCPGKKKLVYAFKDLLRHATDVGKGSQNRDIKHKARHLGLVKYMKTELGHEDLSSELTGLTLDPSPDYGVDELFVYPWMGILANVDGESCSKLKSDLAKRGFDPVRVRSLSGYAVVEFKKEWSGFYAAIMFEKEFEVGHRGKKDYLEATDSSEGLYGWVAREEDYNSEGILGEYLQKYADLKTLSGLETEDKCKTGLLVDDLRTTIEELRVRLDKLEGKCCNTP